MPEGGLPWSEFISRKFGGGASARAAFDYVAAAGEPDGVRFDFDRVASAPNTVDAHRLILFAADRGLQWETADALFRAYFTEGKDLNDRGQLVELATGVGLDAGEVRGYLAGAGGVDEVLASQEEAGRLGIKRSCLSTCSTAGMRSLAHSRWSCSCGRSTRRLRGAPVKAGRRTGVGRGCIVHGASMGAAP